MAKKKLKDLPDELTIILRKPVSLTSEAGTEVIDRLDLHEPFAEDMIDFSKRSAKDGADALKYLIARNASVSIGVVNRLSARDFTRASNYLTAFMDPELDDDDEEDPEGK